MILIGGDKGTDRVNHLAPNLERPVLPIPSFGGFSAKIWKRIESEYKKLGIFYPGEEFYGKNWVFTDAGLSVKLIERLVLNNPYKAESYPLVSSIENKSKKSKIKIFISYAKEDIEIAMRIYKDLKQEGFEPWIDEENLLPGQKWEDVIKREIKESSYFIVLLSSNSLTKRGYFQKEVKEAFEIADELPSSEIFIIPIRTEDCEPEHDKLRALHWVNLFLSYEHGFKQILQVFEETI